ncbi:MAG: hypothetical protein H6713_40505 [Myxococcales bacterium]|nr:hypothetical protein [Myxococcales bacterium]
MPDRPPATLQLGPHAWRLRGLDLHLYDLWRDEPRWRLSGDVVVEGDAARVDLTINGRLALGGARPVAPADLRDATWSVEELELGINRELVIDGRRLSALCDEDAITVTATRVDVEDSARAAFELAITGACELADERVDDLEDSRSVAARLTLRGLACLTLMDTGISSGLAAVWPDGPDAERVRRVASIRARCLAAWPPPEVRCFEYRTGHEGSSNGVITTLADAARPDCLWESLALLRCRGVHEPRVAPARVWSESVEPDIAAAALRDALPRPSLEAARERVERIRRILLMRFGEERPNPALTLILDGRERTGDAAHEAPWPVPGELLEAVSLRDAWNDQLLFVRTAEVDALLDWGTGA